MNLPNLTEVKCNAADAPAWLYNDLFAYEGTASATAKLATQRTLYVPRASARKYRNSKYNGEVGWGDAFGLINEAAAPTQTMTISTFKELNDLATNVNNGSNDYADYTIRLTADLIQNGDERENWYALIPIGTAAHPFRGVFDGQGHTIKNVRTYHDDNNNVGLFGYTDGAVISNLILQNISLRGKSNVGVVVGNANYSMIHDVLAYEAKSTTGEPYYCAEATAGNAGGLVGKADNSTIIDSYFYGRVMGITAAGGIVGESSATDVSDCAAGSSRRVLANCIRKRFVIELWNDLSKFGYIGKRKQDIIWAWMESHGIEMTEANWNTIAKIYLRKRNVYREIMRREKSREVKRN